MYCNSSKIRKIVLVITCLVLSLRIYAFPISDTQKNILSHAYIFEDASNSLLPSQIMSEQFIPEFSQLGEHQQLSYGYSDSSFWIYVDIDNPTAGTVEKYVGTLRPDPLIFNMYEKQGQKIVERRGGTSVPISERPRYMRMHFFKLILMPQTKRRIFFKIKTGLDMTLDLWVFNHNELLKQQSRLDLTHFFYFGTIFSLIVYTLFLFLALKNISFLLYGLFGTSIAMSAFVYSGFLEYLDIKILGIGSNQYARSIFAATPILTLTYCICFLKLKSFSKLLFYFYSSLTVLCTALFVATFIDSSAFTGNLIVVAQTGSILSSFIAACYVVIKGRSLAATYYAAGMFIFIVAVIVWTMGNQGIIEKNYFIAFIPLYGSALEMLLSAIALSWQFKEYQEIQFSKEMTEAEANSLRTLVQVVCHDIANPLSIITIAKRMASKHIAGHEKLEKIFNRVDRASKSIEGIIRQVRRMQAIRAGKFHIKLEEVDLEKVFSEVQFNFEEKAKIKNLTLDFQIEKNGGEKFSVLAEPTSLTYDVLCNFVSNAIKFSFEDSVIQVRAYSRGGKAFIEVQDQGVGVPQDLLENIFSQNKSTSRLGTRNEAGTGFGMPLAKYFIELYGGTVTVESRIANDQASTHGTKISTILNHYKKVA